MKKDRDLMKNRAGRLIKEMMITVADYAFTNILKFNENGDIIKIDSVSKEFDYFKETLKSASIRAQNLIKDKSISLNQKISRLYSNGQKNTDEDCVVLQMLLEYKLSMNYYGSRGFINWYNFTNKHLSKDIPSFNVKQQLEKYNWVRRSFNIDPFRVEI